MGKADLTGRSILVLEDDPLIALDIAQSLKPTGANIISAGQLAQALKIAGDTDLCAAVIVTKLATRTARSSAGFSKSDASRFFFTADLISSVANGPT